MSDRLKTAVLFIDIFIYCTSVPDLHFAKFKFALLLFLFVL